jgi:hypothetical protein
MCLLALSIAAKVVIYSMSGVVAGSAQVVNLPTQAVMAPAVSSGRTLDAPAPHTARNQLPRQSHRAHRHRRVGHAGSYLVAQLIQSERIFVKPRVQGHRLAWCYQQGMQCGKYTADAWCKTNQFDSAIKYTVDASLKQVYILGERRLCTHQSCAGFARIICKKTVSNHGQLNRYNTQSLLKA